jgi:hypothetical protein
MQLFAGLSEAKEGSIANMVFAEDAQKPEGPVALTDRSWLIDEGSTDRGFVTHLLRITKARSELCALLSTQLQKAGG